MTPIYPRRAGLRESWETYRGRANGPDARRHWREEGWRLLGWSGPGTGPLRTSNGSCADESEGEARPPAS